MVCIKKTPHVQKGSSHLLLARMPAPPSSASGSGSQGGGGGLSAGRKKKSAPRKNLTHIKQGTRVWEQMQLLQGYSRHATNLCISKMGFARQVYFNLLFSFIIYVFFILFQYFIYFTGKLSTLVLLYI